MAKKRRKPSPLPRKKSIRKPPAKIKKTLLIRIKGDSARRYRVKGTRKTISRRQAQKILSVKKKTPRQLAQFRHRYKLYQGVRDSFIDKKRSEGKPISKRAASQSKELQKIIRDLHSKNLRVKYSALAKTGRISRDQVEEYVQKEMGGSE